MVLVAATEIIKIDEKNLECPEEIKKLRRAAEIIRNGGLVVFPTETVYGLGANAFDENAVKKIYEAKGRPSDNPLIVHVAKPEDIYKYAEVSETAERIIKRFMPAPLTLVLKKKDGRLDCASPGLDTVAVRTPENKTARKLIELARVPVAAPSTNLSGRPSHTNAEHIIKDLNGRVDMIICGENCEIGLESTVISFNCDDSINILRSGFITKEDLIEFNISENKKEKKEDERPIAPGMKYTHYSPKAPLYILSGSEENIIEFIFEKPEKSKKTGFLCYDEIAGFFENCENITVISVGAKNNLKEQARNLFDALNRFDMSGVDIIYSTEPERIEIGEAIYERLIKASGGKIIKL